MYQPSAFLRGGVALRAVSVSGSGFMILRRWKEVTISDSASASHMSGRHDTAVTIVVAHLCFLCLIFASFLFFFFPPPLHFLFSSGCTTTPSASSAEPWQKTQASARRYHCHVRLPPRALLASRIAMPSPSAGSGAVQDVHPPSLVMPGPACPNLVPWVTRARG